MNVILSLNSINTASQIYVNGSKSESNRLLILQKLHPAIKISNCSDAQDTHLLIKALASKSKTINVQHAGTAMRFLTAYFAIQEGKEILLTGSQRMKERPIAFLVDALRQMGASIDYKEKIGFPPLKIKGKKLSKNKVSIHSNVSSQYLSSLLLIAPSLNNGLEITLQGKTTSIPYVKMTLAVLEKMGVEWSIGDNTIHIKPYHKISGDLSFTIESDWTSASYFYSIIALSPVGTSVTLSTYKKQSLQGDAALAEIYKYFGVQTKFQNSTIIITKEREHESKQLELDLNDTPDIAQTIAITCFGLQLPCKLTGLHTLKIKETDRLEALQTELHKLGACSSITENSFKLEKPSSKNLFKPTHIPTISTYNDHRMAMAFAPIAQFYPIAIENAAVVEKSYPNFWKDLQTIGFKIKRE